MQTRSSLRLVSNPSSNPTPSTNLNPKSRNPITADNFELKHGLLTLVQNKQFFGHDKEDPHAHVRYFNKNTSTLKFPNIPNTSIKLMLFPFSLEGAARLWLEKEAPRSSFTWDDLVLKFINQFFPPSKTTNLRNEITNFQQRFDESFSEAWDRFKDLLRACPHHDKMPRECLAIIESKSKVRYSRNKPVVAKVSMNTSTSGISPNVDELKDMVKALLLDKKSQNQSPALVKAVEESCVTYGGAHSYRNCPATDGNVYHDNIQEFVFQASAVNYNQRNTSYRPLMIASTSSSGTLPSNTIDNSRSDLKAITTRSGVSYDGPQISPPPSFLPKVVEDEPETTKDIVQPTNNGSTEDVQPQVVQSESLTLNSDPVTSPISEPVIAPVNFDADPRVPLILERSFLKTRSALIDVFEGELTFRVGKEAITFNLDQTSRYSANYSDMTAKRIDVIDMACEEYSQEVLGFSDVIVSGNATPYYDPIVSTTSLTLTPFENSDFILEEVDAILAIEDDPTSPETLKRKLTEAPILISPDCNMPFELMCDASDFAIGAVLGQRQDKHFRPIHYASKTSTEAESNYTTTEKEMLAVVASTSSSGTLPSNTIDNSRSDLKEITTRSGVSYDGPQILPLPSFLPKVVEDEPETTKDIVQPTNNGSTEDVQPQVVQSESLILNSDPVTSLISEPVIALLSEMARTLLNEHYSAVLLKKLPKKLGDPCKFLIPCDFLEMDECLALADLGASINLMPFFIWKRLSLPDLTPTYMTLELADHSISRPVRVAEDVYVKMGSFHFPADFVVVDFDVDPRVPLILERSFLKTISALIDVFEGELTLRVGKEAITFNLDQTSRYSANYSDMTAKRIDVIDMACEEYSQEVLGFSDVIPYLNPEGDILLLEAFLNDDPSLPPPNQGNYLPEVRKELKICEAKSDKSSIDEPPKVELKDLPPHLEYAFLEGDDKLPVIIAKDLSVEEKTALITVLKSHKRAIV
nr:reverse transcriptase domain-containing protein [Tanacetum cinerariifolium]